MNLFHIVECSSCDSFLWNFFLLSRPAKCKLVLSHGCCANGGLITISVVLPEVLIVLVLISCANYESVDFSDSCYFVY